MVEIFDNRVEIVSPGGVCRGITKENFGTISITRNSNIASLLHRIKYIEQMGTGIMRMKKSAKEAKVTMPKFELDGFFKVIFKRNNVDTSIGRQSATNRPQSAANQPQSAGVADRKQSIIKFLEKNGKVRVSELINIIGLSEGRVRDLLRQMAKDEIIEKIGKNRYAYYVLK